MADISILDVFEPKVRRTIIEFCKDLNETQADLYIVMARKAACLVSVLEDVGLLSLQGNVISERVMDCDIEWSKYSKVIIIDDVVISGTTLYQTIRKIESANSSIWIDLFVLGVNERWYVKDVLKRSNGSSYIHAPIRRFENAECIRLSGDVVRMLANYPMPYNIDYPIYNKLRLNDKGFSQVTSLPGWKVSEVSSFTNRQNDVVTHAFIPEITTLEDCGSVYMADALRHSLIKIRTYCRKRLDKRHEVYIMTIVPMLVLPPIEIETLNNIFVELSGCGYTKLSKVLSASSARLRFVQFVLADLLARHFIQSINDLLGTSNQIQREYVSLRYLFPSEVVNPICEIADKFAGIVKADIPYVDLSSSGDGKRIWELLDVNDALIQPFLEMYNKDELCSRRLVCAHGVNVFNKIECATAIDRLKRGVSFGELLNRLAGISDSQRHMLVSAFLDKSIDEGIVVPITAERDGKVFRAYRHGEDVQFGQQEERLCYDMLSAFSQQIHRKDIPKLWMEKMLVLLFQLGEGDVFVPIQTSIGAYSHVRGKNEYDVASVKYYLQGPLLIRQTSSAPLSKQYFGPNDKVKWMSSMLMRRPNSPIAKNEYGRYTFDEIKYVDVSTGDNEIVVDAKKTFFAQCIGELFGLLLDNGNNKRTPSICDSELVMLTSCLETRNVIGAMAAEINICNELYVNRNGISDILDALINRRVGVEKGLDTIRKSKWHQALNDGIRKFIWYCDKEGYKVIDNITAQFDKGLYKRTWKDLWSPNMEQRGNLEKSAVLGVAYTEGLWLLSVYAYYLILSRLVSGTEGSSLDNDLIKKIKNIQCLLGKYAYGNYAKDILELIAEFLAHCECLNYWKKTPEEIYRRLESLFARCPGILAKASAYYENTCRLPKIQFYNHALFVETAAKEDERIFVGLLQEVRSAINKSDGEDEADVILIKPTDEILSLDDNQFVFLSHGENGVEWLLRLATGIDSRFGESGGVRLILIPSLHPGYHVRRVLGSKIDGHAFRCFLQHDNIKCRIRTLAFASGAVCVIAHGDNDIMKMRPEFKDYQQTYEDEFPVFYSKKGVYKLRCYQKKKVEPQLSADIAIVTIVDEEAAAVRRGFGMQVANPFVLENRYYDCCDYTVNGKTFKIVHFQNTAQGNYRMATSVSQLISNFRPKLMVLLGIAGGIKDDVNIGDVVIADEIFYYDSRKVRETNKDDRRLKSYKITTAMSHQVARYRSWVNEEKINNKADGGSSSSYNLHIAPIGTGEAVVGDAHADISKWLLLTNSKVCAVETEAAGFVDAIAESGNCNGNFNLNYLVVRGISDKADAAKDDKHRMTASENAVAVLKDFIVRIYEPSSVWCTPNASSANIHI